MTQLVTNNVAVRTALTSGTLNTIAWALQRTVRVLEPNGKMMQSGNHGATLTLVWVKQPGPHYRAAQ